jgi:hypothetical protein
LARAVIRRHLDLNAPENRAFHDEPDRREHHQTHWHQWGIIAHTRVFLEHFEVETPIYLKEWGVWEPVWDALSRKIDGLPRWDLLRVSILLHDIGKFGARRKRRSGGYHFSGHEVLSGQIIREELDLEGYGLTPAQVEYIAMTAEDHFVLGLARRNAREAGEYDRRYIQSLQFADLCRRIVVAHPEDYIEIGVLFLGDSLAKADPATGPEPAISQYGINIAAARRYLEVVTDGGTPC